MHIALGAIPPPNPEPSLMYGGERPDVQHCSVFMDDGFVITNGQMVPCHGSSKGKGLLPPAWLPWWPGGEGEPHDYDLHMTKRYCICRYYILIFIFDSLS